MLVKVEYLTNENPLKHSGNNSICWSKVSNNKKNPYHASCFLNAIKVLGFYINNSSFW